MGDPLEFRVLGPLEVIADGESVRVGGPRPRALLSVLLVHAGELDSARFEALVAAGQFGDALALWRGEPYGGVPVSPDIEAAAHRLSELRLSTVEDWLAGELASGRHAWVVSEL